MRFFFLSKLAKIQPPPKKKKKTNKKLSLYSNQLTTRSENDRPCFSSEPVSASSVGASSVSATSGESRMSARRAAAGVASINWRNFL